MTGALRRAVRRRGAVPARRRARWPPPCPRTGELRGRLGELVGPFVVPGRPARRARRRTSADGEPFGVSLIAGGRRPAGRGCAGSAPIRGSRLAAVEVPVVADAAAARRGRAVLDDVAARPACRLPSRCPGRRPATRCSTCWPAPGYRGEAAHRRRCGAELFPSADGAGRHRSRLRRPRGGRQVHRRAAPRRPAHRPGHRLRAPRLPQRAARRRRGARRGPPPAAAGCARDRRRRRWPPALRAWSPDRVARVREPFTSFGTCSVARAGRRPRRARAAAPPGTDPRVTLARPARRHRLRARQPAVRRVLHRRDAAAHRRRDRRPGARPRPRATGDAGARRPAPQRLPGRGPAGVARAARPAHRAGSPTTPHREHGRAAPAAPGPR